ncbi:MAG: glycosyltransferase family 8 protein [Alphaproteobacteria bacterium]|nr:glycosyltransferase family 8 protein [Alphaproteobacteria bacterium]
MEIPVFFIVPNDMFAPAVVSMVSILENTQSQIKFYILERQTLPISRINRAKLDNLKQKYSNFSVEYISVDPDDFREMIPPISGYITIDTYFRYIVPDVVPDLKKAVYLDVDIIVQSDIAELYNMPLDDYYIGAVNHPKEYWERFPLFYEIVFNLKLDNPYFYVNGGVMLFNCGKYREDKISNLLKEKTRLYKEKIKWADQDIMNFILQGKIKELPWQFNTLLDALRKYKYPPKEAKIIHFNGSKKPWNCNMFLDDLFWEYAKKTPVFAELKKMKKEALKKNTKTFYLFNFIPLLTVKTEDKRKFYSLFGVIPLLKTTRRE